MRYTADGYPAKKQEDDLQVLPSPPEGYKSDSPAPSSLPCCSTPPVQWPPCVPANFHPVANENSTLLRKNTLKVSKKSASAQTDSECSNSPPPSDIDERKNTQETLKESPDEGYADEGTNT